MSKLLISASLLLVMFSMGCSTRTPELARAAASSELRDATLADYLVGTWAPAVAGDFKISQTTFYRDGTWLFTGIANDAAAQTGMPPKIHAAGTYRVDGDIVFETAHKLNPPLLRVPHTKSFIISDIDHDAHVSTEVGELSGMKFMRVKNERDFLHPATKLASEVASIHQEPVEATLAEKVAPAAFPDAIPAEILALAGKTKFKPKQISLLIETAQHDKAAGILAAVTLYRFDKQKYHGVFRARCAYDTALKRTVMPKNELNQMIGDLMAKLGNPSELEAAFQIYHFFRSTGFIYLRDDGSEFLAEKMFSASAFTTFSVNRREKDIMKSTMELSFESYAP